MPVEELGVGVTDIVTAELVECAVPASTPDQPIVSSPDASPTEQAADATIEQTGAGPPPDGEPR